MRKRDSGSVLSLRRGRTSRGQKVEKGLRLNVVTVEAWNIFG
jgi:hypothetical protein